MIWFLLGVVSATAFLVVMRLTPVVEMQGLAITLLMTTGVYVGFAIVGHADWQWIGIEIAGIGLYSTLAVCGLRYSPWWLMLGWMLHPLWDLGLHGGEAGAVLTPDWYFPTCIGFDLMIAVYIGGVQIRQIKQISTSFSGN